MGTCTEQSKNSTTYFAPMSNEAGEAMLIDFAWFRGSLLSLFLIVLSGHVSADEETWPRAGFEPAKTASELGITKFSQSPILDSQDLPPVEERLPDDPMVIVPLAEIG